MKKKFIALLIMCLFALSSVGCSQNYQEATKTHEETIGQGYFATVEQWGGGTDHAYSIVYANDTKVMYFIVSGGSTFGITPLYNADGTLQIYEGEQQ